MLSLISKLRRNYDQNVFCFFIFFTLNAFSYGATVKLTKEQPVIIQKDESKTAKETTLPQIAVMDVTSFSYDAGKTRILTEAFRSEIYKTHLFRIIERGAIQKIIEEQKLRMTGLTVDFDLMQVGKILNVEKIFICSIERFSNTIVLTSRIVDVSSSVIDYAENVFIKDENQIFQAIPEIVTKIQIYYAPVIYKLAGNNETNNEVLNKKWTLLGAKTNELNYLVDKRIDPEEYLSLRQFDISLNVMEYTKIKMAGWDTTVVKTFLQNGITYTSTEKAINLGIMRLDKYQTFQQAGYNFDNYLQAYGNNITSVEEYAKFKLGFKKDRIKLGMGVVADQVPLSEAKYNFFILNAAWEHYWTEYQRNWFKWSSESGIYLLNAMDPVPYLQNNFYFGIHPFYFKTSFGALTEVFRSGHIGVFGKIGMEVLDNYEVEFMDVFYGANANPKVAQIEFPYYAFSISYKFE